jgi:hypothetical protein
MTDFPLRFADRNLLFGRGGQVGAVYRLQTISYPFLPPVDQKDWWSRLGQVAFEIEADFQLLRVNRMYPAAEYVDQGMLLLAPDGDEEAWREDLHGHHQVLANGKSWLPEVYLIPRFKVATRRDVRSHASRVLARRPGARAPIGKRDLQSLHERREALLETIDENVPARHATVAEIEWLYRRAGLRGLTEPDTDASWTPAALETDSDLVPLETDMLRLESEPVRRHDRHVEIESEHGTSRQTFLTLGALPETMRFPDDAELLFAPLERLTFPVDACIHARWVPNSEARSLVNKRVMDADNALDESEKAGSVTNKIATDPDIARQLDEHLTDQPQPPLLEVAVSFCVDDGRLGDRELDRRVGRVRHAFGGVKLFRTLGVQRDLFLDHLPRVDGGLVHRYDDLFTIEQFAGMMPIGSHMTGDTHGVLFGWTTSYGHRPVKVAIRAPARKGRPPSWLLHGTLGSGKTVAAQKLMIDAALSGSMIIDVDPKPDHRLEFVPELDGMVRVLELRNSPEYRGELDPLVIGLPQQREDLSLAHLTGLLPVMPPAWETEVIKAIKLVLTDQRPTSVKVIERLLATPAGREVGEALAVRAESGLATLGFSQDGRAHGERLPQVTTIRCPDLHLPEALTDRAGWWPHERVSVVTMHLIAALVQRLIAGTPKSIHKIASFDEAWFMLDSQDGRRVIDRINHMGRSMNATLLLISQELTEVAAIEGLIGTRVSFGQETHGGAEAALKLHGLDPENRRMRDRVRAYRKGRCLMTDIDGRTAELQVDLGYPHLLEVLDTNPDADERREAA